MDSSPASLGIDVLAIDARGHGQSDHHGAGRGSFGRLSHDVDAAVEWLQRRGAAPILGIGRSQGAAAIVLAAARSKGLAGVVVEAGPAAGMFSATWGLAAMLVIADEPAWKRVWLMLHMLRLSRPFRYFFQIWSALFRLRRTPLIWIHGDSDRIIPRASARLWFRALKQVGGPWREVCVPNAEHLRCLAVGHERIFVEIMRLVAECTGSPSRIFGEDEDDDKV